MPGALHRGCAGESGYVVQAQELERLVRLDTYSLAVKLVGRPEDIPSEVVRPARDLGHRLSTCQAFSLCRHQGTTYAQLMEDMWCPEPVIGLGLHVPPKSFMEGHNRYPEDVETLEAGANFAGDFPRFRVGRYIGLLVSPLSEATFTPDLVVLYCTPAQLTLLLLGVAYKDGRDLSVVLSGHAACVYAVVPPMKTGRCQVAVPCRGDRYAAAGQDNELIFTVPLAALDDLLVGLRELKLRDTKLPAPVFVQPEYAMRGSYVDLAKEMGIMRGETEESDARAP